MPAHGDPAAEGTATGFSSREGVVLPLPAAPFEEGVVSSRLRFSATGNDAGAAGRDR